MRISRLGYGALRRKSAKRSRQLLYGVDQCSDLDDQFVHETLRDIQIAFVFGQIAFPVCLVEQTPLFGREPNRVFETLEHM